MPNHIKTIAVFTGNRAEYGLLHPILQMLQQEEKFKIQLIVSGDHLRLKTDSEIVKDGLTISHQIDSLEHQTPSALSAVLLNDLNSYWQQHRPDCLLILGDRYETFAVALAAFYQHIPIAHIGGGDVTEGGCVDDKLRFMLSEMASLHFVISEDSANRLISRGFSADRVFVTGSPVIDNILQVVITPKADLCQGVGFNPNLPIVLFTQHPIPAEGLDTVKHFQDSVTALGALTESDALQVMATASNQDGFSDEIQAVMDAARNRYPRLHWVTSLGRQGYLSWLSACDAVVGNSSSGLIETPFFKKPSVSIGPRQSGRLRANNVLNCDYGVETVKKAVLSALNDKRFHEQIQQGHNPFGNQPCAPEIAKHLKQFLSSQVMALSGHGL